MTADPATVQVLEALQQGASHDALVCCAGYVLGEYGRLVPEVPTHVQFALLHERFLTVSNETKAKSSHLSPLPLSLPLMHAARALALQWLACRQGLLLACPVSLARG